MTIAPDGSQQAAAGSRPIEQPAYGQQPPPAYGQPVYGQPAYGQPVYAQRPFPPQPQPYITANTSSPALLRPAGLPAVVRPFTPC